MVGFAVNQVKATTVITVAATDVIFLAGRTDVSLAPPGAPPPGYPLTRNDPPGAFSETFPELLNAVGVAAFEFNASGTATYNNRAQPPVYFGPDGLSTGIVNIGPLAGISGYEGPEGALLGVFLSDENPDNLLPPATLDFTTVSSRNFATLEPLIDQVFFIGDGQNAAGDQVFVPPSGATRLYLGVADSVGVVLRRVDMTTTQERIRPSCLSTWCPNHLRSLFSDLVH
jgi:hypothetical protein